MSLVTREFTANDNNYENDIKQKMYNFFYTIFRKEQFTNEYLRVMVKKSEEDTRIKFFDNLNDIVEYCYNNRFNDVYFNICTFKTADNGKIENVANYYTLWLDFDKKELGENFGIDNVNFILKNVLKCYANIINMSGHGYHCYFILSEPTGDMEKVQLVEKELCRISGADKNAATRTQVLRVPNTANCKDDSKIFVKNIKCDYVQDRLKDIQFYYKKNVKKKVALSQAANEEDKENDNIAINYTLNSTTLPNCLEQELLNGSKETIRNKVLNVLVTALKQSGKSLPYIKEVLKEWAVKSDFNDNVDYRIEYAYKHEQYLFPVNDSNILHCSTCKNKCSKCISSQFVYSDNEEFIYINRRMLSKLNKGCGVDKMLKLTDKEFLIYLVMLYNNKDNLSRAEVKQLLTFKKKCLISDNTIQKALNGLTEKNVLSVKILGGNRGNIYSIAPNSVAEAEKVKISYFAVLLCLNGGITAEELKFYFYLRYLLEIQNKENKTNGNILCLKVSEIARSYGVVKSRVSVLIDELIEGKIMSVHSVATAKATGQDYYTYRLIK